MAELVSVIIPAYNAENFVAEAVASALAQTYTCVEVIVVDDGSIDGTKQSLRQFISSGSIQYRYQPNAGLSAARNVGISMAKGVFVALLDADDLWEPNKLARQVEVMSEQRAGLVYSDFATFDGRGLIAARKNGRLCQQDVSFLTLFTRNNFIYPSTVLIRASCLCECGGFDVNLQSVEDYDMWLRIAANNRIIGIDDPLVWIRQHRESMSANVARMIAGELKVIEKHRSGLSAITVRRRMAKVYFLNADRLVHLSRKWKAIALLFRALSIYPFMPVDLVVVIAKLLLGKNIVEGLRKRINEQNSLLAKSYWFFYSRY
jgi:glycosyltransferase involved in cell wall biosynthesis